MILPFAQIDAFATRAFRGNPAAVIALDNWLDDPTLQAIAAENNLSETAFIVRDPNDHSDYLLRWFTPTTEVDLCGHATLAAGHFVLNGDQWVREWVRFKTRAAGVLEVTRDDAGYRLALPAYAPTQMPLPAVVAALGLREVEDTLWHANGYSLIVLPDAEAVRRVAPDFRKLATTDDILTIVTAPGTDTDIVSRVFAVGAGIDEDPVTGSAHAVLTPYWAKRLKKPRFRAYQASARGGYLDCELQKDRESRAILRGTCVTVIEGTLRF